VSEHIVAFRSAKGLLSNVFRSAEDDIISNHAEFEAREMLQLIVLLSIGALWALTSLLSREAQPLPARGVRGQGMPGPRPGLPMNAGASMAAPRTMGTGERAPANSLERRAPARWNEASPATRIAAGRGLGADDGIVILDSDSRASRPGTGGAASAAAASKGRASLSRRAPRGRTTTSPGPSKPVEQSRPRALTTLVTQSMAQRRNRPLEIAPLGSPLAPINSPLTDITSGAKIEHPGSLDSPPAFTAESLQSMLQNPTRLREAALLTELLQPPLALRRSGRRR
jgi:hypothetical protein